MRPPHLSIARSLPPGGRSLRGVLLVAASLLVGSCGGAGTGDAPSSVTTPSAPGGGTNTGVNTGTVTAIAVAPSTMALVVGDTASLAATMSTSGTVPSGGWTTSWQSSDATIVSVSSTGALTALAAGTATITATAGGKSASATVTVSAPPAPAAQPVVTSVTLSPSTRSYIAVGLKRTFSATVSSASPPPASGWTVAWTSSDPAIATVSAGVVTAVAPGVVTISAASGGKSASVTVEVLPQPGVVDLRLDVSQDFSLQVGDRATLTGQMTLVGTLPPAGLVTAWTTSNPAIATVATAATSSEQGVVTAVAVGTTTITVTAYGKMASVVVTVVPKVAVPQPPVTVTGMTLQPSPTITWVGNINSAIAVVTTSPPVVFFDWPIVWSIADTTVAKIDGVGQNGLNFLPRSLGKTTLTAKLNGFTALMDIYVAQVNSFSVTPAAMSLPVGTQGNFTVAMTTTGPLPPGGWPIAWPSSSPLVATVSPAGVVTAHGVGKTKIGSAVSIKYQSEIVTVTGPPPNIVLSGADTVKGTIVQGSQGYSLSCATSTSVSMTGPGEVRWTGTQASIAGSPFAPVGGGFQYAVLTAGVVPPPYQHVFASPAPVATSGAVTAFTVGLQFHYALNADLADIGSLADDYYVARSIVCIP
jgi:trimeric autotransporter adhesin